MDDQDHQRLLHTCRRWETEYSVLAAKEGVARLENKRLRALIPYVKHPSYECVPVCKCGLTSLLKTISRAGDTDDNK